MFKWSGNMMSDAIDEIAEALKGYTDDDEEKVVGVSVPALLTALTVLKYQFTADNKHMDMLYALVTMQCNHHKRIKNSEKVVGTDVCSLTDEVCTGKDCRVCDINKRTTTESEVENETNDD